MSQLALFYLLDASRLDELREHARVEEIKKLFSKKYIDHYSLYLKNNATLLYGLDSEDLNANPFISIVSWQVEEKGIDFFGGRFKEEAKVLSEKTETTTMILTDEHSEAIRKIDFENLPQPELSRIALEYDSDDSAEAVEGLKEAWRALRKILEKTGPGQVVIFRIA